MTESQNLQQVLKNAADILRSKMDANEYKNYTLGFVFYKYLSDKMLFNAADLLGQSTDDLTQAQEIYANASLVNDATFLEELKNAVSFNLPPDLTFTKLVADIDNNKFQIEDLKRGFKEIEASGDGDVYAGLFDDVDLYSNKLGTTPQKKNATIALILKELNKVDFNNYQNDALGDAYEYLLGQFASESGKQAGEFYTPQQVSDLMSRIVLDGKEDERGFSVYDATCGSGSLLLRAKEYSNHPQTLHYYGQELNTSTYNLARMNMIIHGVNANNQHLSNGDTLDSDWPIVEPTNFDGVLMNPPYSAKWSADKGFVDDPRFSDYEVLAPKSKADFAFLLHGYYHLKEDGVMAIVLPHGVLFRGGAEGKIRQHLLEKGAIDTIIGLPANIFYNTSIPTTVIILKKNRADTNRDVLFIDASNDFTKIKTQNILETKHLDKIVNAYNNRKDIDKYAHVATLAEIKENDFNLNIPRYVDTFEPEPEISLKDLSVKIAKTDEEIATGQNELLEMMHELSASDPTIQADLNDLIKVLEGGINA